MLLNLSTFDKFNSFLLETLSSLGFYNSPSVFYGALVSVKHSGAKRVQQTDKSANHYFIYFPLGDLLCILTY